MLCCRRESQDGIETQIIVRDDIGESYIGNSYKAIKLRVIWRTLNNFDFVKSKNY